MQNTFRLSLMLVAVATAAAVASYPARAATAEADFAARCDPKQGVVLCKGLDTANEIQSGITPADDGTQQGFLDTTIKSSGTGSLRFTLRKGVRVANIAGAWFSLMGRDFIVGDTMYVQWRQRVSPEYISNNQSYWDSSIKQVLLHGPKSLCQGAEFASIVEGPGLTSLYTNCGYGFNTDATNNILCTLSGANCTGANILLQQGSSLTPSPNGDGYNCNYQNQVAGTGNGSGCFFIPSNTWVTFYQKIKIGTFGGSNSTVDAWVAVNGGPYKQYQRVAGVPFFNNGDNFFRYVRFETYMTELETRGRAAPVDAYVWYDELIVSTQPIAAPGGLPAPGNLRLIK